MLNQSEIDRLIIAIYISSNNYQYIKWMKDLDKINKLNINAILELINCLRDLANQIEANTKLPYHQKSKLCTKLLKDNIFEDSSLLSIEMTEETI